MPFLRFTRDKRGYEQFALVHSVNRRGKSVSRVLYWYRTPPDVKVGREPFDEAMRRAIETQNPDITFDWRQILETPIPSADADKWRERRRTDRIERAARQALDHEDDEPGDGEHAPADHAPKHVLEVAVDADAPVGILRTIEAPEFTSRESVVESVSAEGSEPIGAQLEVEELALSEPPRAEGPPLSEPPRVEGPALSEPLNGHEGPVLSEPSRVEGRKRRRRRGRGRQGRLLSSGGGVPDDNTTPAVPEREEDATDKDE
jgi:hypothetical protein